MRIGIDIMGGDYAPKTTTGGAVQARKELPADVELVLIGDTSLIREQLVQYGGKESDFTIVHSTEVISMGEHPVKAFKEKPASSISIGYRMLATKELDGFASAGNTGAMMVGAMYAVKTVPGLIRPSLISLLPTENGNTNVILDVGVNADCKPDVLYQFGILGSIYAKLILKCENPRVSLLNIGEEAEKGNLNTQAAYGLMKDSKDFNFVGNIEGRDIFEDNCDVIVCDGFTGNIVIKEGEGFYHLLKKRGLVDSYFERFNYELYGGSPILGINSTAVVGHGISNEIAIKNMILLTHEVAAANLSNKIKEAFN